MSVLHLDIQTKYFDAIVSGLKTIEGRLARPNYLAIKPNQLISFKDPAGRFCKVEVSTVVRFKDFKTMLEESGLKNCIPDCSSLEEAVETYRSFSDYRKQEKILGVVAIHIQLR